MGWEFILLAKEGIWHDDDADEKQESSFWPLVTTTEANGYPGLVILPRWGELCPRFPPNQDRRC